MHLRTYAHKCTCAPGRVRKFKCTMWPTDSNEVSIEMYIYRKRPTHTKRDL